MKRFLITLLCLLCITLLFACDIPFLDDSSDTQDNAGASNNDTTDKNDDQGDKNDTANDTDTNQKPEFYTVTFDSNGGTDVEPVEVAPGNTCKKPYPPIRYGATFVAWYYKGSVWDFKNQPINSDITLVARWNFTEYTIEYDLNGGSYNGSLPSSYIVESETIVLPEPTKPNCKFAGWYLDGKLVTEIPKGSSGNITLVADFYGPDVSVSGSQTAYARTWDNEHNITVRLTDTNNTPLKVSIDFTKQWHTVKIDQGGKIKYVSTYEKDDKLMLDFDMTPNTDDAVITPVILMGDTTLESKYGVELANGTKVDKNYYPGFVRKSVTFTIDDGVIAQDTKFLNIVRPAGIKGTFNLINTSATTAAKYLALYKGYEVANHHQLHCLPWRDGFDFSTIEIKNEIFNSSTANVAYMYKSNVEGLYYIDYKHFNSATKSPYWHPIATDATYTEYIDKTQDAIEKVFGEGSVVGFAYPHGQLSAATKKYLIDAGYLYARKTGNLKNTTNFALPADRFAWTYNADASCLNEVMAEYDALGDDGKLKFFSFGVHAVDFDGKWHILETFARKYGNRPDEFWYASNREIFEYEDAVKALEITEEAIINPSSIDVFVTINNVKTIIPANSTYPLS